MHDYLPWPVSVNLWELGKRLSIAFVKVYFSKLHTCLERHNDRLSSKHFMDHVLQLFKTAGVLLLFANQSKT